MAKRRLAMVALALAAGCSPGVQRDPRLADAPLPERLAAADARSGAGIFVQCAACHSIAQGTGDRAGPNLYGVVGRPIGHGSARFGYTSALQAVGGTWTFDRLDAWLADPSHFAPGTNMQFAGLRNGMDRADVIRFLNDQDSKLPLPAAATPRNRSAR